jgi:hypothetical protein
LGVSRSISGRRVEGEVPQVDGVAGVRRDKLVTHFEFPAEHCAHVAHEAANTLYVSRED